MEFSSSRLLSRRRSAPPRKHVERARRAAHSSTRWSSTHGFDRAELTTLIDGAVIDQTILDTMSRPAERVVPWFEYRNIFMTEERIAAGVQFLDRARRDARASRRALRRRARDDRRDRRHRDLLRHAHGQVPRARRARDARVRVSAARHVLHVGARVVPAAHARGAGRRDGGARLVRRRDGRGAVHSVELSRVRRRRRRRRQARSVDRLGRRVRQRRQLLRQARLAHRRARHGAGHAARALRGPGAAQQPRSRRHRRLVGRARLRVHDDAAVRGARPRRIPSRPPAAARSTGSATTTSAS